MSAAFKEAMQAPNIKVIADSITWLQCRIGAALSCHALIYAIKVNYPDLTDSEEALVFNRYRNQYRKSVQELYGKNPYWWNSYVIGAKPRIRALNHFKELCLLAGENQSKEEEELE